MKELTLEKLVNKRLHGKKRLYKVLNQIYRDVASGKIKLIDPSPPSHFLEYIKRLDYSLWFWTTFSLVILTLVSITLSNIIPYMMPLRYILGSIYVLFIPGYVLIEALYPEEKSLSPLERLALSIGLSLAVIPLIGLVLNYTPWGIRLEPIITSTLIYVLITVSYTHLTLPTN